MNKQNILHSAINKYGEQPQMIVAMEEMAELIKELSKYTRGENNINQISEEIADVEIMIEQLKLMFNCFDEVEKWEEKKLKRLEKRLEGNPKKINLLNVKNAELNLNGRKLNDSN